MSRRSIQVGLGVLWLIDGLLKFQPALWRAGFVKSVIEPNAQGQPSTLAWTISHMATLLAHGQSAWVALFGIIEIGIGLGLLFRRTVKAALVLSFVWAPAVWLFGEGVGGVLTGQASPLMGAPGASYLYALVGALVWPTNADADERRTSGLASSAIGSGRFGVAGGVTVWGLLWFMQAALWLLPSNRASGAIASQLSSMAAGEPGWYAHFLHMVTCF